MALMPGSLPMVERADAVAGPRQGEWTYEDYAALPDCGTRYEIVDGVLYMTPSPNTGHQTGASRFTIYLGIHVELAGIGRVFAAPFDVELPLDPPVTVQPDVTVVLNSNLGIITHSRIRGVPDLVVEVLSPGTAGYDRRVKQNAYARAGVREYWLADPADKTVELLQFADGEYRSLGVFHGDALLPSAVVPDFPVRVAQFFEP